MDKKTYSEKLQDQRWLEVRERILERDGYRCRDSLNMGYSRYMPWLDNRTPREIEADGGIDDGIELHVHHCFYEKGDPWDTSDEYLICVGKDEHADRHLVEGRIKRAVAKICANTRNKPGDGEHGALRFFAKKLEEFANSTDGEESSCVMATLQPTVEDCYEVFELKQEIFRLKKAAGLNGLSNQGEEE